MSTTGPASVRQATLVSPSLSTTRSIATIQAKPAELRAVYAHVGGLFAGVDWIELRGAYEGKPIVERVAR